MTVAIVAALVQATWLVVEWRGGYVTIEKPWQHESSDTSGRNWDRHSSTVWDVANAVEPVGLLLAFLGVGRFVAHNRFIGLVGFALLVFGISIRGTAIRTLGRLFTGAVTIKHDHLLIRHGLYRYVRHPSYTGALIGHLGLGLSFVSWASLALSTIPFLVATIYRIRVEEQALRQTFGEAYVTYSEETWRLIPWLYCRSLAGFGRKRWLNVNDVLFDRPRTEPGNFLTLPNHNRQVLVPCDLPVRLLRLVVVDNQGKTIPVTSSMKLFAFAGPGLYLVG